MNKYEEIEVTALGRDGKGVKYSFNKDAISHYKQYVDSPTEGKGTIQTMLYLKSNPNALRINIGYDTLKKKIGCATIDVSGLQGSQVEKIEDLIQSFHKLNR